MAKRAHAHQTHKPVHKAPSDKDIKIPGFGAKGGDILGHKGHYIKHVDNNILYGAGALLLLGGGFVAYQNGWLQQLPFIGPFFGSSVSAPTSVTVTPAAVPQGTSAIATGSFNPAAKTTFYSVFNAAGAAVLNGTLGTNVTTFQTPLATNTLPLGTYTMTISDSPIPGVAGAGGGAAGAGTGGAVLGINQQLATNFSPTVTTTNENLGASPASGPSNITLN